MDNIVAVHCKAGKGRTGLMIICYLLYCGLTTSATAARKFYDTSRTFDGKGLTIISQIRYVHYFEELLRRRKSGEQLRVTENKSQALRLLRVRMHTIPHMDRDQVGSSICCLLQACRCLGMTERIARTGL